MNSSGSLELSSGDSKSQCLASGSEEDCSLPPIFLHQLSRSPKEILQKKEELGLRATRGLKSSTGNGKEDHPEACGNFLAWEIHLRLFYIGCISSLRAEGGAETVEELGERYLAREMKLGVAREELGELMGQKQQLEEMVKTLRQDQDCLSSLIQHNDQAALQALSKLQSQLQDAECRVAKAAQEVGASIPASSFRRDFPSPRVNLPDFSRPPPSCSSAILHQTPVLSSRLSILSSPPPVGVPSSHPHILSSPPPVLSRPQPVLSSSPPVLSSPPPVLSRPPPVLSSPPPVLSSPPSITSFLQFSNLFALSGQLAEFCQGEHGSKFVVERLKGGAQPERDLVMAELGLPGTLTKHMASSYCREVIRTLIQVDDTARIELEEQARSKEDALRAMEGGSRMLADMFSI